MVPLTCGAAMLVPDIRVSCGGGSWGSRGEERAASTETPGAQRSGLRRPSRVGPTLLKWAIRVSGSCLLYAPTASVRLPLQMVPVVECGSASSSRKRDWQLGQETSRSIHAWYRPSMTPSPVMVTSHSPAGASLYRYIVM